MSVVISSLKDIRECPLNTSKTNQTWVIGKDTRFKQPMPVPCKRKDFYNLPDMKMHRKSGIGIGIKTDFTEDKNKFPPPNRYIIKDFVQLDARDKKGWTMGLSRQAIKVNNWQIASSGYPGAGKYQHRSQLKRMPKYSFRKKYPNPRSYSTAKTVVGPAKYRIKPVIDPQGTYYNTKFRNSMSKRWNPPNSKRFSIVLASGRIYSVGPGRYSQSSASMAKDGVYHFAKFRNSGSRRFGKEKRDAFQLKNIEKTPGPGSYRIPSDFGWYEAKNKGKIKRRRRNKTARAKTKK